MNEEKWIIHYRAFSTPTSRHYKEEEQTHDSDESFFRSWDDKEHWGSYYVCAMYITRNGETVWRPDWRRRYSWEKDSSIDRLAEFRPKEEVA